MKINNFKLKIYLLLIACYLSLIAAQNVDAAALSLSVDPSIIVINAIPPANITSFLNVQNKGNSQVTLQIQFKPFKDKGQNGELTYLKNVPEIFKNIQILDADQPVDKVTLDPEQRKNLKLNINVPQDANISDYYFSIIFTSTNSSLSKSSFSINRIGIATNVLLSVGALETPKATLEEFSSRIFFEKGPVPFVVRVRNAGTHFIQPTGTIIIKNMFGQSVEKLDLLKTNVLSNSIRAIPNAKSSNLLGLYTATLNISMSNDGPILAKTIHFFVFPAQGIIIIVVISILLISFGNKVKAHMNKNRT